MDISEALAVVKAAGYRVTKPTEKKLKTVGPTFVAQWSDGIVTRMSIYTHDEKPDIGRAVRVSKAAYDSRTKGNGLARPDHGWFERAGVVVGIQPRYDAKELGKYL
jgi:hypothetical protein